MKMFKRALSLVLTFALLIGTVHTTAIAVEYDTDLPVAENGIVAGSSGYKGDITVYTEEEATVAGVPAGFTGQVIKVAKSSEPGTNSAYPTCDFDFSSQNIPVDSIESITFRIYMYSGDKALRLKTPYTDISWIMNVTPSQFGAWTEITLGSDGTNFNQGNMNALKNAEGNLGQLAVVGRLNSSGKDYFFIDAIKIKYKSGMTDDKTPPVITYNGPVEVSAVEGDKFIPTGLSAYDEYDKMNAAITYEWSAGALDGASGLKPGVHTCTVKATDRSGNVATLDIVVTVNTDPSLIRIEKIPHVPHDTAIADEVYDGTATELSSTEAEAKGVPAGYVGSVYEISETPHDSYVGVCLDFSGYEIPINLVESISFNVLVPTSYSELRMRNGNTTDWVMRCSTASTGSWCDVTLTADGLNFFGSAKMQTLANADGNLGSLCLIGRVSGNYTPYYIDGIVIKLKTDDKVAPVIRYSGKTDILTSSGKVFSPDIIAFDEMEGREIPLAYEWSAGALDTNGNMLEGEHTCRVSATDYFGNTSYLDLNVTVGPPDVEAPTITFLASEIFVSVGTFYRMVLVAEDNYDDVEVVEEWSEGAIDRGGRLSEGVHTLTLTATDLSGNKTVKVVTVHVIAGDTTVGQLIVQGQ